MQGCGRQPYVKELDNGASGGKEGVPLKRGDQASSSRSDPERSILGYLKR